MAHLTVTNVLLLFLGLLLNLLYALQKAKKESKTFSAGFYIKDNWIQVCITIISAFASLIMADDLLKLFQVSADSDSPFYTVHAFVSGIIPVFIVEKIMKLYKK